MTSREDSVVSAPMNLVEDLVAICGERVRSHPLELRAFATDAASLALARCAVEEGFDRHLGVLQRQFLYMPFQHSESTADQARSACAGNLCRCGTYPHVLDAALAVAKNAKKGG